ncbi:MAG: hypothetical protein HKN59_05770 [Gammaproteobacteria bacterium]|nr:hypothetical protein [Gammaproteobacteria bacterium]
MKIAVTVLAIMIGLLSLAAGGAKIALVPNEVEFLSQFGFTNILTVAFGIAQVIGGLLLFIPGTRFYGSMIAAAGFALSAVLVLASGNTAFAGVSLVPCILAGFVAYRSYRGRPSTDLSNDAN